MLLPSDLAAREACLWLVEYEGTLALLRRFDPFVYSPDRRSVVERVAWVHDVLNRLADLGFPNPRPIQAFDGRSWTIAFGAVWEIVSFLEGEVVGWADEPPIEDIGSVLATYHDAARQLIVDRQAPMAVPLVEVPDILLSPQVQTAWGDRNEVVVVRSLAEQLAADLDEMGDVSSRRLVIHGDFTFHNVLADGAPPKPCGVIDFWLAHLDLPIADIAYGLWRSGRPSQTARCLDLGRVHRFIRGYTAVSALSDEEAGAIPVYLRGRGLQMLAKRIMASRADLSPLQQVLWLRDNAAPISDTVSGAIE
jgi:homoserine kinase type II